jgi:regulatory protein
VGRWPSEPPADLDDPQADPEQVARTILLRRLEAAPRTRAELARTLHERGVPEEVAAHVLDRFVDVGLIDDGAFARMWVESRQAARGLAPRALRAELRAKGVADDLIDEAVSSVDDEAQLAAARAVAARKARSLHGVARPAQVRRLSGALARKGYGPGVAAQVVRETLAALDSDPDELDPAADPLGWTAEP